MHLLARMRGRCAVSGVRVCMCVRAPSYLEVRDVVSYDGFEDVVEPWRHDVVSIGNHPAT